MKSNVQLYVFVKEDAPILTTLENDYKYIRIDDYEILKNTIDEISYLDSHFLIIDLEYVINTKGIINKHITQDLMRSWLSVIGYYDGISPLKIKTHLYRLDFKAILDNTNKNMHYKIIEHVSNYTNIHMEKVQNNFIKAFAHCNGLDTLLRDLQYLLTCMLDHYNLSEQDVTDIYLATSSLIIAVQTNKLIITSELLYTMFKSLEVNKLYKNFATPKSFNEQIVSILYYLFNIKTIGENQILLNIENVEQKLLAEVTKFYEFKTILISSYTEIDLFWEQIHEIFFSQYSNGDVGVFKDYLENIYHILIQSLNKIGYIGAHIDRRDENELTIFIKLFHVDTSKAKECFNLIKINENSISRNIEILEDGSSELSIKFNLTQKVTQVKTPSIRKTGILKQTNIETMHYKDEEKISAHEFLEEFEVDTYMLDDLNENEITIKDVLFSEEELNDDTLETVTVILDKYVSILHETIEFNDLAISLESLSKVFQCLSLHMLAQEKKERLHFYIQGLIDDLQTWKKYIFIEPNTPDIHYLDASLLENCASIEHFIFTDHEEEENTQEDDDDDLEFF